MPVSHLGADINDPALATQSIPEQMQDKVQILCVLGHYTSAECRTCLKQSSDAKYFGTFFISSASDVRLTLHIFSTSKKIRDILDLCAASSACSGSTLQVSSENCKQLIPEGPMRQIDLNRSFEHIGLHNKYRSKNFEEVRQQLARQTVIQHICLQVEFASRYNILRWTKCLVDTTDGIVAILQRENAPHGSKTIQNVKIITQEVIATVKCDIKYGAESRKILDPNRCNQLSKVYFYEPLPTDQMIIVVEGDPRMQKNVQIQFSSKCIWVHHDVLEKKCTSCISVMTQSSERTSQLASIARLTPQTFLAMLQEGYREENIGKCLNMFKRSRNPCLRITFVPDFMCEHELTQSKPSNHMDSSEFQHGAVLLPRYARNGAGVDSPHHRGPTEQAIRLFGVDIVPDVGMQESKNSKNTGENNPLTRYVAPVEHGMSPKLKGSCSEPSVLLVEYIGENAKDCFVSLALNFDVVMFSMTRHYVWMFCEAGDAFGTEYCPNMRILKTLQHENVASMRSLPAESILLQFEAPTRSFKRKWRMQVISN